MMDDDRVDATQSVADSRALAPLVNMQPIHIFLEKFLNEERADTRDVGHVANRDGIAYAGYLSPPAN